MPSARKTARGAFSSPDAAMQELRRLKPYLKRHSKIIFFGFVFVTLSNVAAILGPRIIGDTIDLIEREGFNAAMYTDVLWHVAAFLGTAAFSGVFMYYTRRTIIVASRRIEYELRRDLLGKLETLPMRAIQQTSTGELMALGTNDISATREFLGPAIMYSANTLTRGLFAIVMMIIASPMLTLYTLIPLPLVSLVTYWIGKKVHVLFRSVQEQYGALTTTTQENLSGVRVVRSFTREEHEKDEFGKQSRKYLDRNISLVKIQGLMMPLMVVLIGAAHVIILLAGGGMAISGEATIGELTQFFMYVTFLIWPVISIGWVINIIQRASASMGRLGRIFDLDVDIQDGRDREAKLDAEAGSIEFRNVSFAYQEDSAQVLKDVSFTLEAGQTLGIVGATGSGKTTLIRLLTRLYDVNDGQVLVGGRDVRDYPLEVLRSSIAVVPQESFLFSTTIAENIRFGRPDASMDEVMEAAGIAQLSDEVDNFEKGWDTLVGERGITLSGGQKQRTSIARAIVRKPVILAFDDALSAVDTDTEERILRGLDAVVQQRTGIIIAHRISSVKNADKIIVLDDGRVAESGSHAELLEHDGLYADMYQKQLLQEEISRM